MTTLATKHPGELTLRRFLAEEPLGEAVTTHLKDCPDCSARLGKLKDEQRAFEAEVPFERFAAGVEKSARVLTKPPTGSLPVLLMALAACFVAFFAGRDVLEESRGGNRLKGGASVDFVIAGVTGQRPAANEIEPLSVGERVRIGVSGGKHVLALSIDDEGEVSTVYAETLSAEGQTWLPDSLEFTGRGREYVLVVLSEAPLAAEGVAAQLRAHFKGSGGDLAKLGDLEVPGVQVHRTFLKP